MSDQDGWGMAANRHLLAHIGKQASLGVHYCSADVRTGKYGSVFRDALTHELTAVLVKYKNAWATDMREELQPVSIDTQKRQWAQCMQRADAECDALRARAAAA